MGVKGLLPCLQSITRSVSLERYRGLTVAVDAMSWLHKGVFACDVKALAKSQRGLLEEKASSSIDTKCVNFTMKKVEDLRSSFGVEVILVIDGDCLPSKKEENEFRHAERDEAFQKAMAAEQAGDSRAARRLYAQSCSITYKTRYHLIKACKQAGIAFLVAPYEADAQMARMAHTGVVDLVITEDSDALVYGCPRVLFKIDFDSHQGQEIQLMRDLGKNESPSFRNWTHDMFVFMCILSGCDYCQGIPGIGIKLAHKIVRVHRTPAKIFTALRVAGRMTQEFEDNFWIAFRTFRHQRVFCTSKQQIETLWPIVGSNHNVDPKEVWPFLGAYIESQLATKIANGTLHPATKTNWSSALRQQSNDVFKHSNISTVVEIHHRKDKGDNESRRGHCSATAKENIWHSLVYGSNDRSGQLDAPCGKDGNQQRSKQIEPTKKDMFGFFPRDKKKRVRDDITHDVRPPLSEIYLGGLESGHSTKYIPPATHKDVPIHFDEYSSRLVSKSFKPMSRKRRKGTDFGSKSSRCVEKIWAKAQRENQSVVKIPDNDDDDMAKEDNGVSLFRKDTVVSHSPCLNGLIAIKSVEHTVLKGWDQYQTDHFSSLTHQPQNSSFIDDDNAYFIQPLNSDSSFTGVYTTVTAEPDLFSSARPNEANDNSSYSYFATTHFDSSMGIESGRFEEKKIEDEFDTFFQVPGREHKEEYSLVDDSLLSELLIMQQM